MWAFSEVVCAFKKKISFILYIFPNQLLIQHEPTQNPIYAKKKQAPLYGDRQLNAEFLTTAALLSLVQWLCEPNIRWACVDTPRIAYARTPRCTHKSFSVCIWLRVTSQMHTCDELSSTTMVELWVVFVFKSINQWIILE